MRHELKERHGWFINELRQSVCYSILGAIGDDEIHEGKRLSVWLTQPIRDMASHELVEGERIVGDGLTDDGADALGNLVIAEQLRPGQHVVCVRRNGCGQRGCCSSSDVVGTDKGTRPCAVAE